MKEDFVAPNPNFNGSDSLTFKASDETADSNAATVSITVTAVNDPPSADDDSARTQEDTPIKAIDVLIPVNDPPTAGYVGAKVQKNPRVYIC